jgi:hypothetical protein
MAPKKRVEQVTAYLSEDNWKMMNLMEPIWPYASRSDFFNDAICSKLTALLNSDKGLQKRVMRALEDHITALEKI